MERYLFCTVFYSAVLKNEKGIVYGLMSFARTFLFVGYAHLWYLLATVIAVCAITYLITRKWSMKKILFLGFVLYILGLLAQSWFGLIKPLQNIPLLWTVLKLIQKVITTTRNGIFEGILFMGMGMLFAWRKIEIKFKNAMIGFIISMFCLLSEAIFVKYFHLCRGTDLYLFLIPSVFFLFYIVSHIELKEKKLYGKLRTMSFLIYLIHSWINFPIMSAVNKFTQICFGIELHSLIRFGAVLILSIIFALIFMALVKKKNWAWLKKLY